MTSVLQSSKVTMTSRLCNLGTCFTDSDRKQRYKEAESTSTTKPCHGEPTGAIGSVSRREIGTGDIGWDDKVLRQCQVCALHENRKFNHIRKEGEQATLRLTWERLPSPPL